MAPEKRSASTEDLLRGALEEELVDVTLDVIDRAGVDAVKIRDIAAAAGVSPTSIYNRFGGKDGLIQKALTTHHRRVAGSYEARVGAEKRHVLEEIFKISEHYCKDVKARPSFAAAVMSIHYKMTNQPATDVVFQQSRASFEEVLARMLASGELIESANTVYIAMELSDACHGVVFSWCSGFIADRDFSRRMFMRCAMIISPWLRAALRRNVDKRLLAESRKLGDN